MPGQFLQAVISNDLKEAVSRADDNNVKILHVYICFFYNKTPSACWGSMKNLIEWVRSKETVDA